MVTLKTRTPRGSNLFFPAGYLCLSPFRPIATLEMKMINVDMKSRKASTKEATSDTDEEESTAKPFASNSTILTPKFTVMKRTTRFDKYFALDKDRQLTDRSEPTHSSVLSSPPSPAKQEAKAHLLQDLPVQTVSYGLDCCFYLCSGVVAISIETSQHLHYPTQSPDSLSCRSDPE